MLLLDMHARHLHALVSTLHEYGSSIDMVLDDYTDHCYNMYEYYPDIVHGLLLYMDVPQVHG